MTIREIKVPKVPASAFDKNRKPSDLIRRQIEHLQHVAARHPDGKALAADARRVRTEGQAAAFIGRVTRLLHAEGAPAPDATMASARPKSRTAPRRTRVSKRRTKR
jgi:hypothetical protein